jgi:hypothetical protein
MTDFIPDDADEVCALSEELCKIITSDGGHTVPTALSALQDAFVHFMTLVCPDCRKNIARKLKRDVPEMLEHANRVAAKRGPSSHQCH